VENIHGRKRIPQFSECVGQRKESF